MAIDIKIITKLRTMTGTGVGDCKAALEESGGDIDKAVEVLRKKGALKAAKKSDRATNEGVIAMAQDGSKVATVGLAVETDFAARNSDFVKTVSDYAQKLLTTDELEFKEWAEQSIKELVGKIGENIQLAVAEIVEGEVVGTYLHSNKKLAAVVVLSGGSKELATDLAMQVTAMSPKYIKPEDVPADEQEKEKEIYRDQLKTEGKPETMWDKIIPGKLDKYYKEVCLLKQLFIKDDKKLVEEIVNEAGEGLAVVEFKRYQL